MRILLAVLLLFASFSGVAQGSYQLGMLPSINMNKSLAHDWKLNFKIESRQELKRGFFEEKSDFDYEYLLTDFSVIAAKKVALNQSLAIGHLLRLRDGQLVNRSIQQFIITKKYPGIRLSHRLATDQTFAKGQDTEYRFRYRLATEIALNGQTVDPKEFYLKIGNEYLTSLQGDDFGFEIRMVPMLGYEFSDSKKLEYGLDYRLDSLGKGNSRSRFWIGINWYQTI
jgi:hypothetical protein